MPFKLFFSFPLKLRLIASGLSVLAVALLVWIYFSVKMLNDDISMLLNHIQQDSLQQIAAHIDDDLQVRLKGLDNIATKLAKPLLNGSKETQEFLSNIPLIDSVYNGGLVVYNQKGTPVAAIDPAEVQSNANGYYIDYVAAVLQHGNSAIGPPELSLGNQSPIFAMVVPIRDENGQTIGALQGITQLNQDNFLSRYFKLKNEQADGLMLVDPVRRVVIAATDKTRVLKPIPVRGANPEFDSLLATAFFKWSSVDPPIDPLLNFVSQIPSTGWVLLSESTGNWALAKIQEKQKLKWLVLLFILSVAGLVTVWIFKRQLLPIHSASAKLASQIKSKERWMHTIPDDRTPEIHEIIGGVNQLLSMLGQDDAELPQVDYFAKSLAENMPDVVGYWTSDLYCSYANQGYLKWFGYTMEQMQGIHIKTLLGEQLYKQNAPYIQAVLQGENQQFERQIIQTNGKKRDAWVQYTAHKVNGKVEGFFVFMVDISQVKTRESMARISDAALRAISQGIFITDHKQRILLVNNAFTSITGYEKQEVMGKKCCILQGELTDPMVNKAMDVAVCAGVSYSGEVISYRKDGSTFWNDMTISPVHDDYGHVTHFTGVVRDITVRKKMEDERLRAKMQLERDTLNRSILNSLPVDLAVINQQGVIVALNHPEQTLGSGASKDVRDPLFPSEEGEHFLELDTTQISTFLAPYREQAVNGVQSVLAGATQQFSLEYPLNDSAQPHWSSMTVTPLGQDFQGAIIARQDITDLKQANLGLRQATDIAEKANHAKSHFLATASHDLRQPLSALSLYVGVLGKRSEPHQKALVESIRGCVDSLSELLNDLLDVSKLDAGVVKIHAVDFAVDDVLASHIAIQSVSASMKGLKLHMRPSGVVVRTDPKLLSRIVGNLITNAIRYTQQGGVLLACRKHGNSWWLEVWDTGEGIPADKHHVIFEEFQQLNDTGRTRGSGLGLAIVSKMAVLLGLTIRLRSRVGRGSVFAIELPATKEAIAREQTSVSQNQIPRSLRMAVLDDDSRVLSAMVMALQGVGHEVVAATDAEALVQQLEDTPPDIIISDYRLAHGRTGFEAVASVRKKFGKDDLPAIMVTGDTDPALIRSMADQGIAVHYKPLQLDTLQAFVKESVERRLL